MLELKHIKKSFDGVPVLRDINLEIDSGEIVSILGPSGCGKTTLLNIILGLHRQMQEKCGLMKKTSYMYQWRNGGLISYFRIMLCSRI